MLVVILTVLTLVQFGEGKKCPAECTCFTVARKMEVTCFKMRSFPSMDSFPENTSILNIYDSSFSNIPEGELNKLKNLSFIRLENNMITHIQDGAFDGLKDLFEINLDHNKLETFPIFKTRSPLKRLYLNHNNIKALSRVSLNNLPELTRLRLDETSITEIPAFTFSNNKKLENLTIQNSPLKKIDDDAFKGSNLQELFLQGTKITSLPATGLDKLKKLHLENVEDFWSIPAGLKSITEVYLSKYNSFLCCAFDLGTYQRNVGRQISDEWWTSSPKYFTSAAYKSTATEPTTNTDESSTLASVASGSFRSTTYTPTHSPSQHRNSSTTPFNPWGRRKRRDWGGWGTQAPTANHTNGSYTSQITTSGSSGGGLVTPHDGFLPVTASLRPTLHHENTTNRSVITEPPLSTVTCLPERDAYHPCEDIMGAKWLTVVSFMIGSVALIANLVVVVVMLSSDRRLNVHRFLMCNMAFADFCLGLYIFLLVCVSLNTSGDYYNYVRTWQYGAGCHIAGFLAVFSTELSVYTLTVITIERFFAIVYAMEVNTRLSLRKAVKVMIAGWVLALLLAIFPLAGVNSYSSVAICLPFDSHTKGDLAYVGIVLVLNFGTFLVIAGLYAKMFQVVVGPGPVDGAPQRNDAKVAKRMALLVFTDFVCWTPIALLGLIAAFGSPLIGVEDSKFLLVFFFPLNSLCNPFLYAFFTKAFKREFFALLSRFGFCHTRALHYKGTLSSLIYSRSRTKRSTIAEDDTRSKRISQVSAISGTEIKTGIVFFNGNCNVYQNGHPQDSSPECIPMKGVHNQGFGDVSPENPGNDDVFFNPMTGATPTADTSPRSPSQRSPADLESPDWSNRSTPQISRAPSVGSFHAVEGQLTERRIKKQSVSFKDIPKIDLQSSTETL